MRVLIIVLIASINLFFNSSCLKGKIEYPKAYGNDAWEKDINSNLKKLIDLTPSIGQVIQVDSNWTIACTVIANDSSGNLNEKIIVEDSLGGIVININTKSLYTRFPLYQRVFIKTRGLYLGNKSGTPELGFAKAPDNSGAFLASGIPSVNLSQYIMTGTKQVPIKPQTMSLNTLRNNKLQYINRLIKINNIQIANPFFNIQFASPSSSLSIKLIDCSNDSIFLRTSNYAYFQSYPTPKGNGSIIAVVSAYKDELQLLLRNHQDIAMNENRCGDDGPITLQPISIDSLIKTFIGVEKIISNYQISGTVISDANTKNMSDKKFIIQQNNRGIILYHNGNSSQTPSLGDSVAVVIAGATLKRNQGSLEIHNININNISLIEKNRKVNPKLLSIGSLLLDFEKYESTLIQISNAKITSGGSTYIGSKTLSDATGNIILYTNSAATFSGDPIPTTTRNFIGIPTFYLETKEFKLRDPNIDVQ